MARRSHHEEHENHERWLVSYADFITLLFAFFVVMYSISSVNEGQYRVLSDSIVTAFHNTKSSLQPVQVGELVRSPLSELPDELITPLMLRYQNPEDSELIEPEDESFTQQALNAAEKEINAMADDVAEKMDDLIDDDIISIKRNKFWLEVEIKSSLLFPSGSSALIPESIPVLQKLSDIFADLPNRINVEGFTDNEPIKTYVFPSNWELSAARAAAVVRLFERNGVESSRMASIGYGEYQPIAENDSEEGRAKNRRVVLVVMASLQGRQDERIYEFEVLKDKAVSEGDAP